jgi:hypothetical protein
LQSIIPERLATVLNDVKRKDRGIVLQDILEQGGAALQEKSYTLLSHYAKASWAEGAHGE